MAENNKNLNYEYDPIKETIGGKEAEKVVWSTKALNAAVEGLQKGLPLKANPFIGKETRLLKPDLVYKRTKEELDDYIKCMQDPIYFASKCYLKTPEGLQPVILRDYQVEYLKHLQNHNFSIFLSCRQSGKSFSLLSTIWVKVKKNNKKYDNLLKKYYSYIEDNYININIPVFELYHLLDNSFIGNIRYRLYKLIFQIELYQELKNNKLKCLIKKMIYKLISLLDEFDYKFIHTKLTDGYKTIQEIPINDIEVLTDTGYKPITNFLLTKPFEQYIVKLENGYELNCADRHIFFTEDYNEIFCEDLYVGYKIITDEGPKKITSIDIDYTKISMCDVSVDDDNHRFYTNGILSHNSTTTAIYCLWVMLFNTDKNGLILSKSGPAGRDLLDKIKEMYCNLPYFLKIGTRKWNQSEISFDNNSVIGTEPFSPTAGLGKTINFLILDEFAWCPPNDVELFYNNIIPTITTDSNANVCIMSTQNGFNLFYKLWQAAITKKSTFAPYKVDWYQVPEWDKTTSTWIKRDEKWKTKMVGILGSEENFYYQYGTQFSASDKCLVSRETLAYIRGKSVLFTSEQSNNYEGWISQYKELLYIKPGYDIRNFRTHWYIILVDLAEGGGADSTVFNILEMVDKDKFAQVGYWKCNTLDLEKASLEFWLMYNQLFNIETSIISIEWNTYGALFYNYILNYNEPEFAQESYWRFNIYGTPELDITAIVNYKKGSVDEEIAGLNIMAHRKTVPGFRFSGANKKTACALLKMMLESKQLEIYDLNQVTELENFEDKNGNGSYAASFGHDDMMMTLCQLPMLMQTSKYKEFAEDYEIWKQTNHFNDSLIVSIERRKQDDMNSMQNNYFTKEMNKVNQLFDDINESINGMMI